MLKKFFWLPVWSALLIFSIFNNPLGWSLLKLNTYSSVTGNIVALATTSFVSGRASCHSATLVYTNAHRLCSCVEGLVSRAHQTDVNPEREREGKRGGGEKQWDAGWRGWNTGPPLPGRVSFLYAAPAALLDLEVTAVAAAGVMIEEQKAQMPSSVFITHTGRQGELWW